MTTTTTNALIFRLDAPDALLLQHAGGKGSGLSALLQQGFPVPPGFIITVDAYWHFLKTNGLDEELAAAQATGPDHDLAALERASRQLRERVEGGALPPELRAAILNAYAALSPEHGQVAVRSSATAEDLPDASFAGQHESFLQIQGEEQLLAAVRRCWSSLWTARAMAYRQRQGLAGHHGLAVVVQLMVPAEVAGVLFTRSPITSRDDEMLVNAAPGLGEALVSGQVTPETIALHAASGRVLKRSGPPTPRLDDASLGRLVALGRDVERHAGAPRDIEWALAGGRLWLLQARPITTSPVAAQSLAPTPPGDDRWFPDEVGPTQPFDLWTRANFGEVLPYPVSPLTLSGFRKWGDRMAAQQGGDSTVQLARRSYGRLYANEGAMRQMMVDIGLPTALLDSLWGSRRPDLPPHGSFRPLRLIAKIPSTIAAMARSGKQPAGDPASQLPKKPAEVEGRIQQWGAEARALTPAHHDDGALWHELQTRWEERYLQLLQRHSMVSQKAFLSFALLRGALRRWTGDPLLATTLIAGVTGLHSATMGARLREVALALAQQGLASLVLDRSPEEALAALRSTPAARPALELLERFLDEYGHHCIAEPELLQPRWVERPEELIGWLAGYLRAPQQHEQPAATTWEQARDQALRSLGGIKRKVVRRLLSGAQQAVRARDNSRYELARLNLPRRLLYAELGRRWHQRGLLGGPDDIFFLTHAEIEAVLRGESEIGGSPLLQVAAERRRAFDFWCGVEAPEALDAQGRPIPPLHESAAGQTLEGLPASPGQADGIARLIDDPRQAGRLQPGDILVTRATDPSWTPLFPLVKGLVLEIGGQLSHGAIIAREYGVPAVVNVHGALGVLHDGERITVDGTSGRVYRHGASPGLAERQ